MATTASDLWRMRGDLGIALLRSFVAVVDLGSVGRAALHVGRSQPAVSLQLKRLQDDIGAAVFRRAGRLLELTEAGERLLPLARRLIGLHDQTLAAVLENQLSGRVRIGAIEDFAEDWLTGVLSQFAAIHPSVTLDIRTDRRTALLERHRAGEFDILLTLSETPVAGALDLGTVPICWIGADGADWTGDGAVPLVLLDGPCMFRDLALAAFAAEGRDCRIAFTSHAVSTQWSAVRAGMGVSLRTPIGIKRPLAVVHPGTLPAVPSPPMHLLILTNASDKPTATLTALLAEALREQLRKTEGL